MLKHATKSGWSVQRAIAQVTKEVGEASNWSQTPWSRSSLSNEVFFNGGVDPENALRASNLKAKNALDLLGNGERDAAIATALQGLPENLSADDIEKYKEAHKALFKAYRSRSIKLPVQGSLHVSWSNDGSRLATVSAEVGRSGRKSGFTLWDGRTGQRIKELLPIERSGTVGSTLGPGSFSADGRMISHIDPEKETPIVWDAQTGEIIKELSKLQGASGMMVSVPKTGLSPTGKFLFAAVPGYGLRIYDVSTGKPLWTNKKIKALTAAFTSDEALIISAEAINSKLGTEYQDIRIVAFDIQTGKKAWSKDIKEESWGVYDVILSADANLIGIATSGQAALFYDRTNDSIQRIPVPRVGSAGFGISPDKNYMAAMSDDWENAEPVYFEIATGKKASLPIEKRAVLDIVYDEAGGAVGIPYFPGAGNIWRDSATGLDLINAAKKQLKPDQLAIVEKDRVKFR